MKKAIIIILSVLVILGGTFAGLWFFTDVLNFLKPANENFSIQLGKVLGGKENLSYSEYEKNLKSLHLDGSYSSDFNMKVNVNLPSSYMDYSDQRMLNSSTLKVKSDYDADSKKKSADITLAKDGSDVINVKSVMDGSKLSIKSDDVYDKYLTIDYSKYESFCKKNNIEVDSETKQSFDMLTKINDLDYNKLAYDLAYVSKEDYEELHKKYGNMLKTLVDEDNYSTKKNQKISVGDKDDVKTTAYSLTLTGEDAYEITKKLVEEVKGDSTLKKLIVEKYNLIKEFNDEYNDVIDSDTLYYAEPEKMPKLTESDLSEALEDLLDELEDSKEDFKDIEGALRVTIYSDKKNEPVKVVVEILDDEKDDEGTIIFTEDLEKGKNTYVINFDNITKLSDSSSSTRRSYSSSRSTLSSISELKFVDEYEEKGDTRTGTIKVYAKVNGSKSEEMLKIDYETVDSKSEQKLKLNVTTPLSSAISLDLEYDLKGLDTDTTDVTLKLSGKYSIYSVSADISGTIKSSADVESVSNSVDIFDLSTEELDALEKEIVTNASNTLPDKLSKFGINVTKEEILEMIKEEPTEPTTVVIEDAETNAAA